MPDLAAVSRAFPGNRLTGLERELLVRVAVWSAAHADEFVADLTRWIAVPSVATAHTAVPGAPFGEEVSAMMALATTTAAEHGLFVEDHQGYALSITTGSQPAEPAEEIGLISHLDVVPTGTGWTCPPFAMTRLGDVAIGRGVADNKGPALVDLYLLRALRDLGVPLRHRLRLVLGGSEERGMEDMRWYAEHGPVPRVSLVTDGPFGVNHAQKGLLGVTITVPAGPVLATLTGGDAPNAVPGLATAVLPDRRSERAPDVAAALEAAAATLGHLPAWVAVVPCEEGLRVEVAGTAGHAAFPEGTRNPIPVLAEVLAASGLMGAADVAAARLLAELLADPGGAGAGIAATDVSGTLTLNGVVDPHPIGLRLRLDIRYPATHLGADVVDGIAALLERHADVGAVIAEFTDEPGYHIDPDSPEVVTLQGAFNDVLGTDREPFAMGGGTHSRVLPRAITFGADYWWLPEGAAAVDSDLRPPGFAADRGGPHGADECAPLPHLFAALQVYAIALVRLDAMLAAGPADPGRAPGAVAG